MRVRNSSLLFAATLLIVGHMAHGFVMCENLFNPKFDGGNSLAPFPGVIVKIDGQKIDMSQFQAGLVSVNRGGFAIELGLAKTKSNFSDNPFPPFPGKPFPSPNPTDPFPPFPGKPIEFRSFGSGGTFGFARTVQIMRVTNTSGLRTIYLLKEMKPFYRKGQFAGYTYTMINKEGEILSLIAERSEEGLSNLIGSIGDVTINVQMDHPVDSKVIVFGDENSVSLRKSKLRYSGYNINESIGGFQGVAKLEWYASPILVKDGFIFSGRHQSVDILKVTYTDGSQEYLKIEGLKEISENYYEIEATLENGEAWNQLRIKYPSQRLSNRPIHISGQFPVGGGVSIELKAESNFGFPKNRNKRPGPFPTLK